MKSCIYQTENTENPSKKFKQMNFEKWKLSINSKVWKDYC